MKMHIRKLDSWLYYFNEDMGHTTEDCIQLNKKNWETHLKRTSQKVCKEGIRSPTDCLDKDNDEKWLNHGQHMILNIIEGPAFEWNSYLAQKKYVRFVNAMSHHPKRLKWLEITFSLLWDQSLACLHHNKHREFYGEEDPCRYRELMQCNVP